MTRKTQALAAIGVVLVVALGAALTRTGAGRGAIAFDEARVMSATTEVGTAPMYAMSPGGQEAVAWVSAPGGGSDGRLYVAVDANPPVEIRDSLGPIEAHGEAPPKLAYGPDGSLNALYVVGKVIPGRRFPLAALRFVRSVDGGSTWSEAVTVTDDGDFGSHNFHALHTAQDGTIYATWLDSREGTSTVFITSSTDGGATWEANRRTTSAEACPCCRTAIATDRDGALYVAWRVVKPGNVRDIVVARSDDRGRTFSEPVLVHDDGWVYPGCPHAGPSMQVDSLQRLHISWWTGKDGIAGVHYARSDDGGRTFAAYRPLGIAQSSRPAHVQLALGTGGAVLVAWDDGTVATPRVVLRTSLDGGDTFGAAQLISAEDVAATFPVLGVAGDRVLVAWSEVGEHHHHEQVAADSVLDAADPERGRGLGEVGRSRVVARHGELR